MNVLAGFPRLFIWFGFLTTSAAVFYYGAILSGVYKHPLMAQFRRYGEEWIVSPVCRLSLAMGACLLTASLLIRDQLLPTSYFYRMFPPSNLFVLALASFASYFVLKSRPALRLTLPMWYHEMLIYTSRQERRQIAFAWLRVPRRLRWRMSGDQASFRVWAELVRLTVIYGAYDPDDPWDHWT
ncbi:MAG: hypothetical protein HY866_12970 [Chloroflexi bacterium]|nr:hypothetical protein [Chloroflexota bacterium]